MTQLLMNSVIKRLTEAGYTELAMPLRIASVDFYFTAALRGADGRALDLVLVVDTATGEHGDRNAAEVRQRVEALSRALDITGSRYVLTVILAGAKLIGDLDMLSGVCRVLTIDPSGPDFTDSPTHAVRDELLDDCIRILLPLDVGSDVALDLIQGDPIAGLRRALPATIDAQLFDAVATASLSGDEAVTRALGNRLEQALGQSESSND